MGGWVGGWVGVKAVLRIAYSNQKVVHFDFWKVLRNGTTKISWTNNSIVRRTHKLGLALR
jgi:hypothetical protein